MLTSYDQNQFKEYFTASVSALISIIELCKLKRLHYDNDIILKYCNIVIEISEETLKLCMQMEDEIKNYRIIREEAVPIAKI
jgi:hypothetical protein